MSVGHTEATGGGAPAELRCAEDRGVRDVRGRLGDKWTVHATAPPRVEHEPTPTGHEPTRPVGALADRSPAHRASLAGARRAYDDRRRP